MKTILINGRPEKLYLVKGSSCGFNTWCLLFGSKTVDFSLHNPPPAGGRRDSNQDRAARERLLRGLESGIVRLNGLTEKEEIPGVTVFGVPLYALKATLEFANGEILEVHCRVRDHEHWERQIVFQERMNPEEGPESSPVHESLLCHVLVEIATKLDPGCKSAPSFSLFFIYTCRDQMTQAAMQRKHGWPLKTLRSRKKVLERFLKQNFQRPLTFKMFSDVFPLFAKAMRQQKRHALIVQERQRQYDAEEQRAYEAKEEQRAADEEAERSEANPDD